MLYLITLPIIGLICGWIANRVMGGKAGVMWMMLLGVLGSFVGPVVLRMVGLQSTGLLGFLIASTVGAIVCIGAIRFLGPKV